ncbi:hypothetical protein BJV74DRAFT_840586 [Russula compacta]|nr:hypothetical protein BJV74DRAFT_840586 [Russula compacta]
MIHSFLILAHVCLFLFTSSATSSVWANPLLPYPLPLVARQTVQPYFPDSPPSCPICEKGYSSINSCAQAAPALANLSSVIANPGAFINVIKCSCTDTFQSVFPQCVDCFEKTNQTAVLDNAASNSDDLPSLVKNIRELCAEASSIFGNVSNSDGETTPSPTTHGTTAGTSASTSTGSGAGAPSSAALPRHLPGSIVLSTAAIAGAAVVLVIFASSLL